MSNTGLALNLFGAVFFGAMFFYAWHIMAQRDRKNPKYLKPQYDKVASKHPYRTLAVFTVLYASGILSGMLRKGHPAADAMITILIVPCMGIAYLLVRKYWG
jgi:hypothetical protein